MEITIIHYLIICPLVFIAGFVDAVAGGGGLIALPAYMIAGFPVHYAIGTHKLSSGLGTLMATVKFARSGYIDYRKAFYCVLVSLVGSYLGAHIALSISEEVFKKIMLVVVPVTAYYILKHKEFKTRASISTQKQIIYSILIAFSIGLYDGIYGPGTGTFLILLLTSVAGMALKQANGIAKAINVSTNISALVVYLMNGKTQIVFGLIAGGFCIVGNLLGTHFFDSKGVKGVRVIMLVVLAIFFIKLIM